MQLSTKSWHAKLYEFIYKDKYPTNLCPYFWKVILGLIFVIPCSILSFPILIIDLFSKNIRTLNIFQYSCIGILFYSMLFICFIFISPILALIGILPYNNQFIPGGIFLWLFLVLLGIIKLILYINNKAKEKYKEPTPNIFKEYIKARYNKYCPKIDWKK